MSFLRNNFWVILLLFMASACVEPYDPEVEDTDANFLVVEGFLNASDGSATVTLTRTVPVTSGEKTPPESGASVSIEVEQGLTYPLAETSGGVYTGLVNDIRFNTGYRLLIQTNDDDTYASDFISLQPTPAIDAINYSMVRDGLLLTVNTHDATGETNYYRWKYWETFEYTSNYISEYMFLNDTIDLRPMERSIYQCWRTIVSTGIFVASTQSLTESVVQEFPLITIPRGSKKVVHKYSLLVQQQALSEEAYYFWLNIQKTTERLGGLFDPLPSEVSGNIHGTTTSPKKVIGFFSGGSLQEERIFIDPDDLPVEMLTYQYPYCEKDTLLLQDLVNINESSLFLDAIIVEERGLIGYTTSTQECIDCTVGGGTAQRPDFWE
ncbi:MAG TPA: DUF4249 domain-containing protein [Flavitalea sp.]|nr:DUF4249 domain-containing protein [Flavitalea sp.]